MIVLGYWTKSPQMMVREEEEGEWLGRDVPVEEKVLEKLAVGH